MSFIFSTRLVTFWSQAGALRRECHASSLVLLPSLPLIPRLQRQADGQLSPLYPPSPSFSSFGADRVEICCLPRWSETPVSAVSSMSDIHRRYKARFALNMWRLNRPLYLRTQWMRWQRRSQFEHDHRPKIDRAPQITASFTRDRRQAHWYK